MPATEEYAVNTDLEMQIEHVRPGDVWEMSTVNGKKTAYLVFCCCENRAIFNFGGGDRFIKFTFLPL